MPRTAKLDKNLKPGQPLKSANLSDRAAREWDRLVGELAASQIQLSEANRPMLSLAATIAADIAAAWEVVKEEGQYLRNPKTGVTQLHPAAKMLNELRRDYIKVLAQLGARAVAAPPPDNGPSLEDILNGRAESPS
jgi:phage terminase small subunit